MIRYQHSRIGIFRVDTNVYGPNGWVLKEEECTIVGETKDSYTTRFLTTMCPFWDEFGQYEAHYTMAIGIHKSRFVKWKCTQISMF